MCPHTAIAIKLLRSPKYYYKAIKIFRRDIREFEKEERKGEQLKLNL
jgi:hypothetical protein